MGTWVDQKNAVVADTVYCDNMLAAKNVSVSLPEITFSTAEINAMGTIELPLVGLIDAMEASITKVGTDLGLIKMLTPEKHSIEVRFVQNSISADGKSMPEGCKTFLTGIPKSIPGVSIEVGNASENEVSLAVTRYQLYVNGEELLCIDKLNSICRINGKDYFADIAQYL